MLEELISSKTRVKLLTLFLLNPGKSYYIREIERLIGKNYSIVRHELSKLESFGLIRSETKGNQKYYSVDQNFFLYQDLQKIVLKTEGVSRFLQENLAGLGNVECIFIYGSFASGKASANSDIDLFIVGDLDEEQLVPLILESERSIGREINYTLANTEEFTKRLRDADPFIMTILNGPKVTIFGDCRYNEKDGIGRAD